MYGIFTYMNGWFLWEIVGKYTSPMDPQGYKVTLPNWGLQPVHSSPHENLGFRITKSKSVGAQVCGQSIAKSLLRYKSLPRAGTRKKRNPKLDVFGTQN